MYRFDWFERLKLYRDDRNVPELARLSPVIWGLGFTSLLTDVSSEMVSSTLPAYLYLHLRLGPLQYGIVDGLYNGFTVALVSVAAGYLADRGRRHKLVAVFGYLLSALCKPALLLVGGAWTWIVLIIGVDRLGKGIRTAPRDAIISLNAPPGRMASAFALHRSLDSGGAMLGPVVALAILAWMPGAYDVIWVASLGFAVLGLAVLALFVPQPAVPLHGRSAEQLPTNTNSNARRRFRTLAAIAFLLALTTVSDGFIYIHLQRESGLGAGAFPLYALSVAGVFMLASLPVGRLADHIGRRPVLLAGYALLAGVYLILLGLPLSSTGVQIAVIGLLGVFYAATEGVIMAMGSVLLPAAHRTLGLAALASMVGLGKAFSSVAFGALMQWWGSEAALGGFALLLPLAVAIAWLAVRE